MAKKMVEKKVKKGKAVKAKKEKHYPQYLGFWHDEDGDIIDIQISGKRFKLFPKDEYGRKVPREEKEKEKKADEPKQSEDLNSDNISFEFNKLIGKCVESISAYNPLITLSKNLFGAVYSQIVLKEMYDKVHDKLDLIAQDNFEKIYGVSYENYAETKYKLNKIIEFKSAFSVIPSSTLLSLVATFDSILFELLTVLLKFRPEIISDTDSSISIKDLMRMGSFREAKNKVISQKVETLMRGSHQDQVKYCLLYTSPSPRDKRQSRMPSSA